MIHNGQIQTSSGRLDMTCFMEVGCISGKKIHGFVKRRRRKSTFEKADVKWWLSTKKTARPGNFDNEIDLLLIMPGSDIFYSLIKHSSGEFIQELLQAYNLLKACCN